MRILLITQGISPILEPFVDSKYEVVGIIESAPRKNLKKTQQIFSFVFRGIGRGLGKNNYTLKEYSQRKRIPYYYFEKGDSLNVKSWIEKHRPELIIVYSMSQLLKSEIIDIPKHGIINLHPSYLPEYRGPNPVFWQYYDYILNPGVTVHYVDEGEDTGDIIVQDRFLIKSGESLQEFYKKLYPIGIKLLMNAVNSINDGSVITKKQPKKSPTKRARNISKDEYKNLIETIKSNPEIIAHLISGYPIIAQKIHVNLPLIDKIIR
jgi:methionyl-tRNA formyltransferase